MNKPKIALMGSLTESKAMVAVNMDYLRAIWKAGGVGCLLPYTNDDALIKEYAQEFDGFLFCGGVDIDPKYYDEPLDPRTEDICPERDEFEYKIFQEIYKTGKPILGICRGEQVINAFLGGKLIQHIDGHDQSCEKLPRSVRQQNVNINKDSLLHSILKQETIFTNTFHHQVVKTLGKGLVCDATSSDGYIEAYHSTEHPFLLAVQWHPESYHHLDETSSRIFDAFLDACSKENCP